MKNLRHHTLFLLLVSATAALQAQSPWLSADDMPNAVRFLPAPPDSTSAAFAYDIAQYQWGKEQRKDSVRLAIAVRDAVWSVETICHEFSAPFGVKLSKEDTPEIYKLLVMSLITTDQAGKRPKDYYHRQRPYVRFGESTIARGDEEALRHNGSYPSGHTLLGWSAALLLTELNPDAADTLMARGYMYGQSRVIAGYHWQSDVDAARLTASAAVARLHADKRFRKQMQRARKEYARKAVPSPTRQFEKRLQKVARRMMSAEEFEQAGLRLNDMEQYFNGNIVSYSDAFNEAIDQYSRQLATFLSIHGFYFDIHTIATLRLYCAPDGTVRYCRYRFMGATPTREQEQTLVRLTEQFTESHPFPQSREYRFAITVTYGSDAVPQ